VAYHVNAVPVKDNENKRTRNASVSANSPNCARTVRRLNSVLNRTLFDFFSFDRILCLQSFSGRFCKGLQKDYMSLP
jgi:hypothetical protein